MLAWHGVPMWQIIRRVALEACARGLYWRQRRKKNDRATRGIALIGFLETASGLGAAARGLLAAVDCLQPLPISISPLAPTPSMASPHGSKAGGPQNVSRGFDVGVHVYNPDVFLALVPQYGGKLWLPNRLNLAVVNWETERLPAAWPVVLALYERLAAPSRFTAEAVRRATGRTVHVLPNCVPLRPVHNRATNEPHFEFLCLFDALSDFDRKNPLAAIHAFRKATSDLPRGVTCRLRVKCHSRTQPAVLAALHAEAGNAAVEIIAETLSDDGMQRLWDECDCLVSLHRSEGFGLPVAEALARGIPVIATRQGGILDFVDDRGGLLIDGMPAIRPAAKGLSGYREWSGWIDPDIPAAAAALRRVISDYPAESARARVGRERLREHTSPAAVLKAYLFAVSDDPASQAK